MPCVHYKFSSQLSYDAVTFSGLHIPLCDLKRQIMGREKLKATNCDLQISNAQTNKEYTDDNALIAKNSSVIVRRIPVGGVKGTSKTCVVSRTEPVRGPSKPIDDSSGCISLTQLIKNESCHSSLCLFLDTVVILSRNEDRNVYMIERRSECRKNWILIWSRYMNF
ncbi:E3 ubiquitin-protein ligase RBBP6-like [Pelecanus crispus]|uniref:E3 ubiquitin-protein ligase RBBP6-like n=1 Tax=Pelecanus crispus TaxID=36300 RepID=UPI003F5D2766